MKDKVNDWFSFSRASFLVLPRVLMESMDDEWQEKFVELLEQYDNTFDDGIDGYPIVQLKGDNGKMKKMPEWVLNYRHPDKTIIEGKRK